MALSSLFTIASCSKEDVGDGTQFRATMEDCTAADSKIVLSGTALHWVSGDHVAIYGTAGSGLYSATPQDPATEALFDNVSGTTGNGPFRAFYPASLTTDGVNIALPAEQTYVENSIHEFPMYAESATTELEFKNLCGVLRLRLAKAGTSISRISVTANAEVNGTFAVSYANGVPYLSHVAGGSRTATLVCATAQDITEGKDFYITLPPTFDSLKSIVLTTDDGRVCTKTVTSGVCVGVERSAITKITLTGGDMEFVVPLPEGSLPGLFSVSPTRQVRFSQGNLQYQASTDTWRFANNQYDYLGYANSNISDTYSGWIDLFGWGTGNNPTLTAENDLAYDTYVDWGENAISNGGDEPDTWRTLTGDEWNYLLYTRTNASGKIAAGSVNGVHGLILLPDDWAQPEGCTFNVGFSSIYDDWAHNRYTLVQWAAMEEAGALFLPAAGHRWGTSVTGVGSFDFGDYWSSTPNDENSAYCLNFYSNEFYLYSIYARGLGRSVRLVQDNN